MYMLCIWHIDSQNTIGCFAASAVKSQQGRIHTMCVCRASVKQGFVYTCTYTHIHVYTVHAHIGHIHVHVHLEYMQLCMYM